MSEFLYCNILLKTFATTCFFPANLRLPVLNDLKLRTMLTNFNDCQNCKIKSAFVEDLTLKVNTKDFLHPVMKDV